MMHANLGYMVYNNHSSSSGSTLRVGKLLTVNSPRIHTSHGYSLRAATTGEWCPIGVGTTGAPGAGTPLHLAILYTERLIEIIVKCVI